MVMLENVKLGTPKMDILIVLTLKGPIMTAADSIYKLHFHCFIEKIRLDISCESSARQRVLVKNQALISLKDKSKKNS